MPLPLGARSRFAGWRAVLETAFGEIGSGPRDSQSDRNRVNMQPWHF